MSEDFSRQIFNYVKSKEQANRSMSFQELLDVFPEAIGECNLRISNEIVCRGVSEVFIQAIISLLKKDLVISVMAPKPSGAYGHGIRIVRQ